MATPLEKVKELKPIYRKLAALGYRTLQGVVELARVGPPELVDHYLGVNPSLKQRLEQIAAPDLEKVELPLPPEKVFAGADLDKIPPPLGGFTTIRPHPGGLPVKKHLRDTLGPPVSQGIRRTCVAFAACAVLESAENRRTGGKPEPGTRYSPQYLYFNCKQIDQLDKDGTFLSAAFASLKFPGNCVESKWPYVYLLDKGDPVDGGTPPSAARGVPPDVSVPHFANIDPRCVEDICAQIAHGFCVAVTIPIYATWSDSHEFGRTGDIVLPLPHEDITDGHAICLVGYEQDRSWPGHGFFVFRNSWGDTWPRGAALPDKGYGRIPFQFIADHGREAFSVLELQVDA